MLISETLTLLVGSGECESLSSSSSSSESTMLLCVLGPGRGEKDLNRWVM